VGSAVTLLSDFGLRDSYVGQMKGALLSVAPEARWVDLCHEIPAQDVQEGAFVLWSAVEAFPAGTIHLAVIDPGVGGKRKAVAAKCARGDVFVGPDNGLLTYAVDRLGGLDSAVELTQSAFWGPRASNTFHGRDVFAPVAGHLSRGVGVDALGAPLPNLQRPFLWPLPQHTGEQLLGCILHVDAYGNLITNIPAEALPSRFEVQIGSEVVVGPSSFYQQADAQGLLALVGSSGLLEIAVREGRANALSRARKGTPVCLRVI
jgi:S-adenosyl-L-methionine hydrolase (adenosine-forming)